MSHKFRYDSPGEIVSPRQLELLILLGSGMTLGGAAERMGISRKSATSHKCRLMHCLELGSRQELIEYARHANLVAQNEALLDSAPCNSERPEQT